VHFEFEEGGRKPAFLRFQGLEKPLFTDVRLAGEVREKYHSAAHWRSGKIWGQLVVKNLAQFSTKEFRGSLKLSVPAPLRY
jgi:hypothetical protein